MANKKNVRNQDSLLYRQLTRLFSGPIVNYRAQTQRKFRKRQLDKKASLFKSAGGLEFKKSDNHNIFQGINADTILNYDRLHRYSDFDQMEYTPEIASSLDIYADEITTSTRITPLLTIECHNQEIKDILEALFLKVLNVEHNLFGWARTMCKYGDFFLYLDIDDESGVESVIGLPANEVERLEGEDKTNPNYVQYQWNSAGLTFEQWQIGHFRILGNDRYAPYGTSVLEPVRRIWRQLTLLEDAMMAYRITRSPERRVFYFDVGTIPSDDIEQFVEKARTQLKRNQVVDPNTGRVDLRYNPMSIDEDYYIPVRGAANNTRIETLAGGQFTGDIDDVKYLRDKLFSGLKIPASYLARGEGADEDKTTLAQKDIRFARTIQRIQRAIVTELEKIAVIHLYTLGFRSEDLVSFKLFLNNPSKIAELQELEHWKVKFDTAGGATEKYFSRRWIAKHIFNLSDEEFQRNQREMYYDAYLDASLEQVAEGVAAEAEAAMGGGDLGGELGGDELGGDLEGDDLGGDDLGGDEGGDEGGDDDSALLAAPAKRDAPKTRTKGGKVQTKTEKMKDWYTPKSERGGDMRKKGGRIRSRLGDGSREKSRAVRRNTHQGYLEMAGLTGLNLSEGTNYDVEEKKLLEAGVEVKNLIANLEMKDGKEE
jgi:hypothetical protein